MEQFFAKSKKDGMKLTSSGQGGLPHLTIELLKTTAGGNIVHVPYKGGGPAISDAMAGHVDGVVMDLAALLPHFKSGKLRPLVVATPKRDNFIPDVPSAKEAGLGNFEAVNWMGLFAPAKTPQATLDRLNKVLTRIVQEPEVAEKLRGIGLQPQTSASSQEFTQFVATEFGRWAKVANNAGLKSE
jgi:tripartite-type tricarboxylate transporter receptor subunit TctC